jgi:hypothetical protein
MTNNYFKKYSQILDAEGRGSAQAFVDSLADKERKTLWEEAEDAWFGTLKDDSEL